MVDAAEGQPAATPATAVDDDDVQITDAVDPPAGTKSGADWLTKRAQGDCAAAAWRDQACLQGN
eukprot:316055-Chlamydomonas_euryale.AAC.1